MSILGAMFSAVSGLSANSNALGIISDNIANANTVGYKDTSANFSALVTQSGSPNLYSPGGVQSAPAFDIEQQGVLQSTGSPTDLALTGGGFFVVNSNPNDTGAFSFTRAGSFTVNANGDLKNAAGLYLQGQPLTAAQRLAIANGNTNQLTATTVQELQTVNVDGIGGTASATANVTISANLPANDTTTSAPRTMTVPIFDSLGIEHDLTLSFTRTATANQWQVSASVANAGTTTATIAGGDNIVQFNTDGSLNAGATTFDTANALSIAWDPAISGGTSPQKLTFDLASLSQLGSTFSVGSINQDGVKFGNFTGVTVDSNGIVSANFDNGLHQAIFVVPIATFPNADGLTPQSGDTYLQSDQSGQYLLSQAGSGAAGTISSSSLEDSTVDIAAEFSKLIITQNAYQANSKVITTADQMLQALLNTIQ
jgi:flagellar hook protein FlgE